MFFVVFFALIVLTALLLATPFLRASRHIGRNSYNASAQAAAVYAAQLKELERDLERESISQTEYETAKAEVARRLLQENAKSETISDALPFISKAVFRFGIVLALFLPASAFVAYLWHGNLDLATRQLPTTFSEAKTPQDLVLMAEARMRQTPEDAKGWDVLGSAYVQMRRLSDAKVAFERALRHGEKTAPRLANLAEAEIMLANGAVEPNVQNLLQEALELEPENAKALSFLALAAEQGGDEGEAQRLWQKLQNTETADPRYKLLAQNRIAKLSGELRGPEQSDIKAAEQLNDQDRQSFIASMVEGLQTRLMAEGGSLAQWQQLVRSQIVLGDFDNAQQSVERAQQQFADDPLTLKSIESMRLDVLTAQQGSAQKP